MVYRVVPRRLMALIGVLAVAAVGLMLAARPVAASWGWCWDDPVLSLNGQPVAILTGVQGDPDVVATAVQSAETTVSVPRGVRGEVLSSAKTYFKDK